MPSGNSSHLLRRVKFMNKFPEIVTFRITSSCTQECAYCYGPKNVSPLGFGKLKEIFELFALGGVKGVLVTGGEPLIRGDIGRIFKEFKRHGFKIFLDTNGDLFFKHNKLVDSFVDVLSLPLDSASESGSYRKENNFDRILRILEYYKKLKIRPKIKIGTVATKENIFELSFIGDLLKDYSVDIWKIYQFIPIGQNAVLNKGDLLIENDLFSEQVAKLRQQYSPFFEVIVSPREDRASAYFMLNPDGKVIMPVDNGISCKEIIVGDILDEDVILKWQKLVSERNYLDNTKITFNHKWQSYPMKPVYNRIWQIAQLYNENGQFYTAEHIGWHIKEALTLAKNEGLDESIFVPFVILHDVGYSQLNKENSFKKETRRAHMEAGAEITKKILLSVNYPKDKTERISRYVSSHDRWAFGENEMYKKDKILGIFNDLDFISMFSKEGFLAMGELLRKDPVNLFYYLQNNEKIDTRPFLLKATKKLFDKYLMYKKQEIFCGCG